MDAGQRQPSAGPSKVAVHPSAVRAGAPQVRADEMALVERCRNGDLSAFEEVYRAHAGRLYSVACRMLGNPTDAEESPSGNFPRRAPEAGFVPRRLGVGTWLYRLARTCASTTCGAAPGRTNQLTDALDDEPGLADAGSRGLADRAVTRMDLERALHEASGGVSRRVRAARHRGIGAPGSRRGTRHRGGHIEVASPQGTAAASRAAQRVA